MKKSIPIIRERESEAFILGNGREREFPLTPGPGKEYGLFLLLDPKPYHLNSNERTRGSKTKDNSFKLFVHSLAQFTTFGPGSYGMTTLKRMTHTKSFDQLPEHQKKCLAHNREICQTQMYLDQVEKKCKCVPWALAITQRKSKVSSNLKVTFFLY